jgi:uncharacterized membrane protein YbaN (DUF454 family)
MKSNSFIKIKPDNFIRCSLRYGLLLFAWLNVALGLIGIVIPGLPTTVFLIIAAWAFSKSSERFHKWLWNHPRFGASIQSWHNHRVIPKSAKIFATSMMLMSFFYVTFFVADDWILPVFLAVIMVPGGIYIFTCDSLPPLNKTNIATETSD